MIQNLYIRNYKSIDRLDLNYSRTNILIGQPNSCKSNILESLDLSYLYLMMGANEGDKKENKDTNRFKKFF